MRGSLMDEMVSFCLLRNAGMQQFLVTRFQFCFGGQALGNTLTPLAWREVFLCLFCLNYARFRLLISEI